MAVVKVAHVTVVHGRDDIRIWHKQCTSLQRSGLAQVSLFVADGGGDDRRDGVMIQDIGRARGGRLGRAVFGTWAAWRALARMKPDLVHLHDPELLPLALLLRTAGARVVFDMHENLPLQILGKGWIAPRLRGAVSALAKLFQTWALRNVPTVFAERSYALDFPEIRQSAIVLNYPLVDRLLRVESAKRPQFTVGYVGGVSVLRGALSMVRAVALLRRDGLCVEALLIGPVDEDVSESPCLRAAVADGWLHLPGRMQPDEAWQALSACHVGLALLRTSPNYAQSYPTKLFEYMGLGLPVIVSAVPLWQEVVQDAECGVAVDPNDPECIASAIRWLRSHPAEAAGMGARGRNAVIAKYSWDSEFAKLRTFYSLLLSAAPRGEGQCRTWS